MDSKRFELYEITSAKEKKLFEKATVFFDTSALLDFYYYSNETTDFIFKQLFKTLKGRLLITSQTEYEFLKNRDTVIQKPVLTYDYLLEASETNKDSGHLKQIESSIDQIKKEVQQTITGHFKTIKEKTSKSDKHPFLDPNVFLGFEKKISLLNKYSAGFEEAFKAFKLELSKEILNKKKEYEESIGTDKVLKSFQKWLRTTEALSHKEVIELTKEGELRYRNSVPPGYLDEAGKIGFQKYGDLIVWKELLLESKKLKTDVILIINDLKEDWWSKDKSGKTIAPRHELIKEFKDECEGDFWMYSISDFLHLSDKYLAKKATEKVKEDVKSVLKLHSDDEQSNLVGWAFRNVKNLNFIEFEQYHKDRGWDFAGILKNEKRLCFVHKRVGGARYTQLLLPLRSAFEHHNLILKEMNFSKMVLIIEATSLDQGLKLVAHLERKNPQSIIASVEKRGQVFVVYNDGTGLVTLYNSDED